MGTIIDALVGYIKESSIEWPISLQFMIDETRLKTKSYGELLRQIEKFQDN